MHALPNLEQKMKDYMDQPSLFITLEGIDGCGKSTLANNLAQALRSTGKNVLLTKEPGGSALGVAIRHILHEQPEPLEAVSEFLLFAADRAEHFRKIIVPALNKGSIVISDRCADSSLAYQGYARGVDVAFISLVNDAAMAGITPNVTFFIELDPQVAFDRITQRGNKLTSIEERGVDFFKRAHAGFKTIFSGKSNVITLDGMQSADNLTQQAIAKLKNFLQ